MKKIISREVFRNTFILRADYKKKIKKKVNGVSYEEGEWRISETIIRERQRERFRKSLKVTCWTPSVHVLPQQGR